jgi:alcohol dehydrogenase, propanol-preferring
MRAMVLEDSALIETLPLKPIEVPVPWPRDGEVRIKIAACAICRTDLHVIEGELQKKQRPLIPGHQIVGTIDVVGNGVSKSRVGARVGASWLRHTCGSCQYCETQQENLCDSSRFTGYHADGGFAEYATIREDFTYDIPSVFEFKEAAPLMCSGIVGFRALKRSQLPRGGTLGIFGFGSSAHLVLPLAKARGARVYVVTRGKKHQELATALGADWVGEKAFELPRKLDSAILFAPTGELVPSVLAALRKGGTLSLAGIHLTDIPGLNYEKHLFYEKNIHSVTANTREDGREFLAEAAAIRLKPQITSYPLDAVNQALRDLKMDLVNGSGVIVP